MSKFENTKFEIGSLDFRYFYELVKLCSPEKRENAMTGYNGYICGVFHIAGVPTVTLETVSAARELCEIYKNRIANIRYEAGRSLSQEAAAAECLRYQSYILDLQQKADVAE